MEGRGGGEQIKGASCETPKEPIKKWKTKAFGTGLPSAPALIVITNNT